MRLRHIVPAAAAALVLAGCSQAPTVAATVDGTVISQREAATLVEGCPAVGTTQVTEPVAVSMLVRGELMATLAEQQGVDYSVDDIDSMLKADPQLGQLVSEQPECLKLFRPSVGTQLVSQSYASSEEMLQAISDVDVEVNPRYGEWDPQAGSMVGSGSLSVPAEG